MSILRRSLLLGAAACVAAAGTVFATTAYAAADPNVGELILNDKGVLVFTAGADVANVLSVHGTLDPIVGFSDTAAPIKVDKSAEKMCKSISDDGEVVQRPAKHVRCTGKPERKVNLVVKLGNEDDQLDVEAAFPDTPELAGAGYLVLTVHGGPGRDHLDGGGSGGPVTLYGESGRDRLEGGRQNDLLDAGPTLLWRRQTVIGNEGKDTCKGSRITTTSCES